MSYADDAFWDAYGEYLAESEERHEMAVDALLNIYSGPSRVAHLLDFGCGAYCSAYDLIVPDYYTGVDAHNPGARVTGLDSIKSRLYHEAGWDRAMPAEATAFSSMFSAEPAMRPSQRRAFYEKVFEHLPNIRFGIVAGFYYNDHRRHAPEVNEAGGLVSQQTLAEEGVEQYRDLPYRETAVLQLPAPSRLFGPSVVEVWKLLERL